ncbi:MAG TPA: hypothetical protein VH599_18350 [Ktedonobacterales bacterium]|jgi:excisionase family DNA binding protein
MAKSVVQAIGEYVTIQGAAEKLGSTFWTVYGWVKRNNIPTIRVGRTIMVRLSDLSGLAAR